jgi:hypothetical protein
MREQANFRAQTSLISEIVRSCKRFVLNALQNTQCTHLSSLKIINYLKHSYHQPFFHQHAITFIYAIWWCYNPRNIINNDITKKFNISIITQLNHQSHRKINDSFIDCVGQTRTFNNIKLNLQGCIIACWWKKGWWYECFK